MIVSKMMSMARTPAVASCLRKQAFPSNNYLIVAQQFKFSHLQASFSTKVGPVLTTCPSMAMQQVRRFSDAAKETKTECNKSESASDDTSTIRSPSGTKVWVASTCLEDHIDCVSQLPSIMGAYVGSNAIEPRLNESIMVTVNSANQCPYCTGLHGELARMAGVEKVLLLLSIIGWRELKRYCYCFKYYIRCHHFCR